MCTKIDEQYFLLTFEYDLWSILNKGGYFTNKMRNITPMLQSVDLYFLFKLFYKYCESISKSIVYICKRESMLESYPFIWNEISLHRFRPLISFVRTSSFLYKFSVQKEWECKAFLSWGVKTRSRITCDLSSRSCFTTISRVRPFLVNRSVQRKISSGLGRLTKSPVRWLVRTRLRDEVTPLALIHKV